MLQKHSALAVSGFPALILAASLILAGAPAVAQDSGCADCHDDITVAAAPHGNLDCSDCHSNVSADSHPDDPLSALGGGAICAQCHDVETTLETSSHADLACTDCHGPAHDITPVSDLASPLSPLKQFKTCGTCHDEPPDLVGGYLASVHAKALLVDGLATAPTCSTCHGSHDILPPDNPDSTVASQKVPTTCGSCHRYILDTWEKSTHGQEWLKGNEKAPVCITCHTAHEIVPPMGARQRLKTPDNCGNCHENRFSTYRDGFHGKATDIGFLTAATCSDCHTPHLNLPAKDPDSTVNPAHLKQTCGKCHDEVTASFVTFDPHSDPRSPTGDRKLYYVWLFMTSLLVGVFGFFGLHDALWLQRSVVGVLRGESSRPAYGGPHIRRFTRTQTYVHAVIIVTFLLLAATGLPLKFHQAPWAMALADLLGGPAVARILHRLAAIATFGYFLFHVVHVIVRALVHHEKGLFWGWKSMVPRGKDFADIWNNLKYFLYLGKRPRVDRWAYWEKFDYFAVFWGVLIIGTSGLILWFPTLAARLLPGWALNAAYIVHSDEALLAVGFIFIFHFFHTHLRPESFPLDPVILVGSMPLEKFKEERPIEYERLVASGELEKHLVDPPARGTVRVRYAWGFLALFVGLLLIAAILYSLIP